MVTLYVSGKNPGEFSTIVSTIERGKRAAIDPSPAQWIQIDPTEVVGRGGQVELDDGYSYTEGLPSIYSSGLEGVHSLQQDPPQSIRTQSLDSQSVPYG